jgi:hypothetical protein
MKSIFERVGELQENRLQNSHESDSLDDWMERQKHDNHVAPNEGFNHSEGHNLY